MRICFANCAVSRFRRVSNVHAPRPPRERERACFSFFNEARVTRLLPSLCIVKLGRLGHHRSSVAYVVAVVAIVATLSASSTSPRHQRRFSMASIKARGKSETSKRRQITNFLSAIVNQSRESSVFIRLSYVEASYSEDSSVSARLNIFRISSTIRS